MQIAKLGPKRDKQIAWAKNERTVDDYSSDLNVTMRLVGDGWRINMFHTNDGWMDVRGNSGRGTKACIRSRRNPQGRHVRRDNKGVPGGEGLMTAIDPPPQITVGGLSFYSAMYFVHYYDLYFVIKIQILSNYYI